MATTINQQLTYDDLRILPEDDPLGAMFSDLLVAEDAAPAAPAEQPRAEAEPLEAPALPDPVELSVSQQLDNPPDDLPAAEFQIMAEVPGEPEIVVETQSKVVEAAAERTPAIPFPLVIEPEPLLVPPPDAPAAPVAETSQEVAFAPVRNDGPLETNLDAAGDAPSAYDLEALISEIDRENRPSLEDDLFVGAARAAAPHRRQDSCIVFLLAGTHYAIPIRHVLELDAMPRITTVPNVPGFVRGVTNLRGEIVVVLDLRVLLGLGPVESAERGRILIVQTKDQQTAALAVDEVRGTAALALAELSRSLIPDPVMPLLLGIGEHQNHVLNVLDVDKLFGTPEFQQFGTN
ncbi:MAG TPA: chemotaxis protein CheW [Verrucomicrobiae bacterium]|nr:chemotaxis protein CheW [Verrucomicrobiae bacterium]